MKKLLIFSIFLVSIFTIILSLFPYLRYQLLQFNIPINSSGILLIDEVNSIPDQYWKYLDKSSFKFYTRKAPTANDVEIYRVEDKDTVIFLQFNPGDSCGIELIDQVKNPKQLELNKTSNTYSDGSLNYNSQLCPIK